MATTVEDLDAARAARQDDGEEPIVGQQDLEGGEVQAPPAGEAPGAPEELTLRGDAQLSMFEAVGGKAPGTAKLTLRAKTLPLEAGTAFRKGTRVKVEAVFVVDEVGAKDSRDKPTGMVVDAVLKSSAFMEDVRVIEVSG